MGINLAGLPIAITGASSGIGQATALACARAGMPVAVAARRLDRLTALVKQIEAEGGSAIAVRCDVVDPGQCRELIDRTVAEFGSIYSVFANAGYGLEKTVIETTDQEIRDIFETNFYGTLNTLRPAIEAMSRPEVGGTPLRGVTRVGAASHPSKWRGHLLVCSSCLSKIGVPLYSAYCSTKAAQDYFSRAMRHELRSRGIYSSSVHPVGTRTELFDTKSMLSGGPSKVLPPESRRNLQSPDVVARAIVRCLRRPHGEVWTSPLMRLGMAAALAMPSLADRGIGMVLGKRLGKEMSK